MKDGVLLERDGRFELRFERPLDHPVDVVWRAITEPSGLAAWFPFDVEGPRETGAPLRFVFRHGEGDAFDGRMVEFVPRSVMELEWEGPETLRLELVADGAGCVLTLINRFDDVGKAARDAAGWHACLDALGASLDGASSPEGVWAAVHPRYVDAFGPEASTVGPPAGAA